MPPTNRTAHVGMHVTTEPIHHPHIHTLKFTQTTWTTYIVTTFL